jgi:hypothetical protein
VAAAPWSGRQPLTLSAAPGESEPATFVIYAKRRVRRVDVRPFELRGRAGRIPATAVRVRAVLRRPTRRYFAGEETEVVGRFLPPWTPAPLGAGRFREVWIDVDVPADTAPGVYTGRLEIDADGDSHVRLLRVRVRPMRLTTPSDKTLGVCYRAFARVDDGAAIARELADIRAHGVSHLLTDLRPTYRVGKAGEVAVDTSRLATGLDFVVAAGFAGTVVVDAGLVPLAGAMGHDDVAYPGGTGASLQGEKGEAFREQALAVLRAIAVEAKRHPQLDVAVQHLDEVFSPGRLDLFLELAKLTRREPRLPIFASFSTVSEQQDRWRELVDPYVDIRANHGYSFEWWVIRGHDWDDYARELERSGDRGWFYHNERGTYFTARWARLINGLYLWAGPFESHVTWVYQRFDGNPFDDTDGGEHDFGLAFPDPADPAVLVPTRGWMAIREGFDDLRYLATLRAAVREHGEAAPGPAASARAFLDSLAADVLRPPAPIDARGLGAAVGTPDEAPYVAALSRRYDAGRLALVRDRAEELTLALVTAGESRSPSR